MSSLKEEANESSLDLSRAKRKSERLLLFEQFGAIAYGIILQIIPNEKDAQEVLVKLFSGSILEKCRQCDVIKIACIVKNARLASLEFNRFSNLCLPAEENVENTNLSNTIFNLSFKLGNSLDAIASKLSISKQATMKYIKEYFMHFRKN